MGIDSRHRFICAKVAEVYGIPNVAVVEKLVQNNLEHVTSLFQKDGVPCVAFSYEAQEAQDAAGEWAKTEKPQVRLGIPAASRTEHPVVYFVRCNPKGVSEKSVDADLSVSVTTGEALANFRALVEELFVPVLQEQAGWGKSAPQDVAEFLGLAKKFGAVLREAYGSLQSGIELAQPDAKMVADIEVKPYAFNKAAEDPAVVQHMEGVLEGWCAQVEALLDDESRADRDDDGPDAELEYWRSRVAKLNSITEQLKSKECRVVLGVCMAARSKAHRHWKMIDLRITDVSNEAKDNVKYLLTLEKSLEAMYNGAPQNVIDAMPTLMNNVKMMHTIARYYSTPERMTSLLCKITSQLITNCKHHLLEKGRVWDQNYSEFLERLRVCMRVRQSYQEQYYATKERAMQQSRGRVFEFDEQKIFNRFDLFCKRVSKLISMFTTVSQFGSLAQHTHIEGLGAVIKRFAEIADDMRRKPYDLLDYLDSKFDRDLMDFDVQIHDLETQLQAFINSAFENISSTEQALNLLAQFETILQRDTLKADLQDKYMVIFHNYGFDLEAVQGVYERHKSSPPLPRNAPPIAGSIMWARQLLRRIEEPMRRFSTNQSIMASREAKKIVRMYNRVAQALIKFEMLWVKYFLAKIDRDKAGLNATLLVRHPETGRLLVNFDRDILQLMREAKYLQRMGIEIPESAKMVLLQEEKFKSYYNQLTHVLSEYERVERAIPAVLKPIMAPHIMDLEQKIQPGLYILTWTSMNIDAFLYKILDRMGSLEELVRKVTDMLDNRVEANLKKLSRAKMVSMPTDQTVTFEDFMLTQSKFIKRKLETMIIRNGEVQRALEDIVQALEDYPRNNTSMRIMQADVDELWRHYSRLMYQAILKCIKASFRSMKERLGSSSGAMGFLFVERPFFDVDVELSVPNITLNPTLESIQHAINTTAKRIIGAATELSAWGPDHRPGDSFFSKLAADKEVVVSILLLTGSIEGLKKSVVEYLEQFDKFSFLWRMDMQAEYDNFMKTEPELEDLEVELKKYDDIEQQISSLPPVHNIGCLSIETRPLKSSLKAEAAAWKAKFSQNLHQQGKEQLDAFTEYVRDTSKQLESYNRKIESLDLDDVRNLMYTLAEVREKEADIDNVIMPVEDMYNLLMRFAVRVPKDEADRVSDMRYGWEKLRKLTADINEKLTKQQAGLKRDLIAQVRAFLVDVAEFRKSWDREGPMVPGLEPMEANSKLQQFKPVFEAKRTKWHRYEAGEELFGLPVTQYPELEKTEKELQNLDKLYGLYVDVVQTVEGFSGMLWVEVVEQLQVMMDKVNSFQARVKKLPKALREWPAYNDCRKAIDDFQTVVPLLEMFAAKAVRPRHWQELQTVTGHTLDLAEDQFRLGQLLACNLLEHQEELEDLAMGAVKEEQIELKLAKIEEEWNDMVLVFADYRNRGPVILKGGETAEMIEKLEDTQMQLGSMATNRFSAPFRDDVQSWVLKLSTVFEVIEQWLGVQNMWQSLEVVFSGGDIVKQLPQEAKRFQNIDKNYMKVITSAQEIQSIVQTCYGNELMKSLLPHLSEQLELCQKSLSAYLEAKRAEFPRFYFVSDTTLLQILSVGSDPEKVQPHFQSGLFDSLSHVSFDKKDKSKIVDMASRQGEVVPMDAPVDTSGNIEVWLQRLVDGMKETVKQVIKRAVREVDEQGLDEFIFSHPAQVSLLGIQLQWTTDMQNGLSAARADKKIMSNVTKKTDGILREMVELTVTKPNLTAMERTNLETCITVHVHQRDVSDELLRKRVRDPTDFEWLKQCRFYWNADKDTVIISITDVDFEYSYEYLGVKERLVITPLTDICYITLAQALGMCLGGAPAGPAGTGKTETTKDMGNTLGKYVVVFNCSDQFDFRYCGKIYKGLAQSGLWGCFDEFNRINLDVLSVCAQQVFCVLSAIRERKREFLFTDGCTVPLDPRVGYFITMNPGYAGRQELPENLKSLFRGVTMMVPNRQIIMKVKLASCGYQENDILAKKFFVLYGLCEQQLSKQRHYDFGLRNILSVLRTAGASKRTNPDKSEVYLMMRTLRDMNMSKFVAEDVPLFLSLIDDLFPGLKVERATFADVESALRQEVDKKGLQQHKDWLNKCIQLYETYLVRHGIMLVGPTGGGKTAICECLAGALTTLGRKHLIWKMNPKSITAPQMFGMLDNATQDWTDGIFAVLWRKAARESKAHNTWIVLDGPVDAIWIENLNTVLDDNKVLTLANGDRILMTPEMKAMFEPENLNNASPATVSRAGIIYVSDTELGWKPVVTSWLQRRKADLSRGQECELLEPMFEKFAEPVLEQMRIGHIKNAMQNQPVCMITSLLDLLRAILAPFVSDGAFCPEDHLERLFLYALCWAVGGVVDLKGRSLVDAELRKHTKNMPELEDEEDTIFEYMVDPESTNWAHWKGQVHQWQYPKGVEKPEFASLVIPTLDSARLEHLIRMCTSVNKPVLLVGGAGTAKTTVINSFIAGLDPEHHSSKIVAFSYLTTPGIFQRAIEAGLEKNPGRIFRPAGGKKLAVFIDDISMPRVNEWGDQITNELTRQLLEQRGFYQHDKPIGDFKTIDDHWYFAAMNIPGGGKNDVPNRLKRQFQLVHVPLPTKAVIHNIFGTLVAGRFDPEYFSPEVVEEAGKLVPMTIALWTQVQAKMLPTPAKFHYLFNIRELSKVFQGVILASTDRFSKAAKGGTFGGGVTTPEGYLIGLWMHECRRVFIDKLATAEDKQWTEELLEQLLRDNVSEGLVSQVADPLFFVDFLREPIEDPETGEVIDEFPSYYEAVAGGLDDIRSRVEAKQQQFNENSRGSKLELVYFNDALQHLMRISRLLTMDRGSGLLVGVGGSGKQSLCRMASYISGAYTFQITITKTYNMTNLFEDLKALYKIAGLKGQKVCFLFTDSEVKDEAFLESINQILMTGEVGGMFPKDEQLAIMGDVRPVMRKAAPQILDTPDNLWSFFINRVRQNLHVMLCFSPVGEKFSRRAQQFPGLINGCTIDWFMPWPEDALVAVSQKFIGDFDMACEDDVKAHLQQMMGHVHIYVTKACAEYFERFRRHVYVTPKSYLAFINGYQDLYSRKRNFVQGLADQINGGLAKMNEAKEDVNKLKAELVVMNRTVEVKSAEVKQLLAQISEQTAIAEKEKQKASSIAAVANAKAAEIGVQEAEANKDLAAAEPALREAEEAAKSIKEKDIKAVMGIRPSPPPLVKRVFDCVLLLKHLYVQPLAWETAEVKSMDLDGKEGKLTTEVPVPTWEEAIRLDAGKLPYDISTFLENGYMNDEVTELLFPYTQTPDFHPDIAKKASGALMGLCAWSKAMVKYHNVAKVVEPKREALRSAQMELKAAMKEKKAADDTLAEVQAQVDALQAKFDDAMREKQALEDQAAACSRKMDAAANLLHALAGEETRWNQQSAEFDDQIRRLTGDCAVASAFVSYLGPFNKEFRELLLRRDFYQDCVDLAVPVTKDLRVARFLVDDSEIGEWNLQGLPTDELSIQNGIMVTRAARYPLMVDPQGQARSWLVRREADNRLQVTSLNDKWFRNHLEECLSEGRPMLIENVEEELDPLLDPVLERRVVKKGRSMIIQLADKEVDFSPSFRLYVTTRLPNPHFSPELSAKVTVVDFTVTLEGLEDQLLGKLILRERYELEEQRQQLMAEANSYKRKIKQLEDDLLFRLSNSQGNLLDDTELIDVLANTKKVAQDVTAKLATAEETNDKITEACEEFRPVAHRAALIYFLIAQFSTVNVMYQTSLKQFEELYDQSIEHSEKAAMPSKRIQNIIDFMTYHIYIYIQRGLFERHKLTFALMLTNKILVSAGAVKHRDVDIFIKGGGALDINAVRKKPKEWIPDSVWLNVVALSGMEAFSDIQDRVAGNDNLWKAWYDLEAPEAERIPVYEDHLTRFERMCIVKAFREDRTLIAADEYISDGLGKRFVESVPLSMEKAWTESHPRCPLICLLSRGADPTKLIEDLAKKKKKKILGVSMGQGQEVIARSYMKQAKEEGHWVLLQNTHLGLSYLTEVEQNLTKDELHPEFRLWITAEPHPQFPIGLLQIGIKITNEAPVGMKAGLRSSYAWVNQDMLDAVPRAEWRQLLFVMCFLHSITQERRKFGSIGWNIPYEFNQSDLSACVQFLQNHLMEMDAKKAQQPTWETVRYMISVIMYGGRITDDFDQLLMNTYAEKYFHTGVLQPGYELFKDPKSGFQYFIPEGLEVEQYRQYIENLPSQDSPEIFGLHTNADLTFRSLQVQDVVRVIIDTQPKSGGGSSGMSREEQVDQIAADLLSKTPSMFEPEEVRERLRKLPGGPTQPLTVHLRQEVDRLNTVLSITRRTLRNLRLAIAGTIILTPDLQDALSALFNARIPQQWLAKSWEAATLGNWFGGLVARYEQLYKWLHHGRPRAFWLTGFFNPQGFLTAMKQEVNRKHANDKWALDDVIMTSEVTHPPKEFETLKDAPSEGVYVWGLYLDGCAWSGRENKLVDSEPKKLFHPLPILYVTGCLARDKSKEKSYSCPCYRVKARKDINYVCSFDLKTEEPSSKWVMRGVALLCSID
ncbi:unnamed protein product [Pedinophyceae sp. YPF-701]|nr:unnamed protein product [Pedinophyceae sp. YPF-701]